MKRYKDAMEKFMEKQRKASEATLESCKSGGVHGSSEPKAEDDTEAIVKVERGEAEAAIKEEEGEQQEASV